jgi:V8-like Glu-specific endopeptidase
MNISSRRPTSHLPTAFFALTALAAAAWPDATSAQSRPFNIPDLSSYNCAAVDAATAAGVRHMGQVINGRYHEWHEIYANVGGQQRLACISLIVPEARQMSTSEARAFLKDAAAVGVPDASAIPETPQGFQKSAIDPLDVPPMPLRRAIKPAPGTGLKEKKAGEIEVPPIPAIKDFNKAGSTPAKKDNIITAAPKAAPFSFQIPSTIGVEDRVAVSNTLIYPWNTVGYLVVTYSTNESFRCSGVLVSAYTVLTAGHCVHDQTRGGFVDAVTFYPAQYQSIPGSGSPIRPYANSDVAFVKTTQVWTQISGEESYIVTEYQNDFATVQFNTPFTFTSTFMPVAFSDTTATGVTNSGYPASVGGQSTLSQYFDEGPETSTSNALESFSVREFAVDGSGGNSGGPFLVIDSQTNLGRLVGLLSYGNAFDDESDDDESGGPWYSSFNQSLVSDWMSFDPTASPAASVDGLRVAAIFSSAQPSSRSFLRFYNSGSTAGTADVTLADYESGDILGTWTSSSIPAGAEVQFFIQDIENGADQTFTAPSFYSVSIRPTFAGYFQHVLWKPADGTLTNLSTCDTRTTSDISTAVGVHSSLLQNGYPSSIAVHNTGTSTTNVVLGIYDARNGNKISNYNAGFIPANGQVIVDVADMEAGVFPSINPSGTMFHFVVKVEGSFTGYLQHLVNNQAAGVITDMTAVCTLAP